MKISLLAVALGPLALHAQVDPEEGSGKDLTESGVMFRGNSWR